jgi:hypothetical protein
MHRLGGLFWDSNEGLEPALAPKRRQGPRTTPNQVYFTYLSVREEELWAGDGRLFPAALTVHGDGI